MNNSIENNKKHLLYWTIVTGILLGLAGVILLRLGNPPNMGICAACFLRDTAGGLRLFSGPAGLQYLRPEIPGFVLGSFLAALIFREFRSRGGASPVLRFLLGAFVMIGALVFLGCPIRLMERLAGGDWLTGGVGLLGMVAGVAAGSFCIKRGFTLGAGRDQARPAALFGPIAAMAVALVLFILLSTKEDSLKTLVTTQWSAPVALSFIVALGIGFFAQRSRFCTTGGFRDLMLSGELRLFWGYVALLATLVAGNLLVDAFWPGTVEQFAWGAAPIAHEAHLWGFLGMFLTGLGSVLLGGCPFRQMIATGQGNADGAITVMGLLFGAAFCHNFGLASKPAAADSLGGPGTAGMAAVILGIAVALSLGFLCRERKA